MSGEINLNKQGQVMGSKGRDTERRLLKATNELINRKPLRDIRVADIARRAETATSTFYLYFEDVEDAVLTLTKRTSEDAEPVIRLAQEPWPEREMEGKARTFVKEFFDYWDKNQAVLRLRNMVSEEGDKRFAEERVVTAVPFIEALAGKIQAAQADGRLSVRIDATTTASILFTAMERMGAAFHATGIQQVLSDRDDPNLRPRQVQGSSRQMLIDNIAALLTLVLRGCLED